ncbi:MAG: HEAT repeat domain-containing protein [Egibacteraceae bacterium]
MPSFSDLGGRHERGAAEPGQAQRVQPDGDVRWPAVYALGRSRDERAVDRLLRRLRDTAASVRWGAAWALRFFQDERPVEPLLARLDDPDVDMRRWLPGRWASWVTGGRSTHCFSC